MDGLPAYSSLGTLLHPELFAMFLLIRSVLVVTQALSNHWAFVPPNKTPEKGRFHTEEAYFLQIAPTIFKVNLGSAFYSAEPQYAYSFTVCFCGASLHLDRKSVV